MISLPEKAQLSSPESIWQSILSGSTSITAQDKDKVLSAWFVSHGLLPERTGKGERMHTEFRKYTNVSRVVIDQLRSKLREKGINLSDEDHAEIKHMGYKIEFEYSENEQALYVLVDPPLIFSPDRAWEIIDPAIGTEYALLPQRWKNLIA